MLKDDSGQVVGLLVALVAGIGLSVVGSLALTSAVAGTPDAVKPPTVSYDVR